MLLASLINVFAGKTVAYSLAKSTMLYSSGGHIENVPDIVDIISVTCDYNDQHP